ncbi:hypothetical protein I6F65_20660 [Pseudoalteromonas sp. SWXJZ94C]|uniref:hypothetical protein n=1 Tax=Pseudoalteromonas sp. SWXJZ94C TaxID=2792065 RepID=UPI0018CE2281|nr:hypothetical protein [Pseudoalteromonas sp. SWXJZ94C]MBH0059358.1 hypothetical protein [Pseudoalteromonas sp. SWXJZ94C]
MIDFDVIEQVLSSNFNNNAMGLCRDLFNENPEYRYNHKFDKASVVMPEKGVSVTFEKKAAECLFFHFDGDDNVDIASCALDVIFLNKNSTPDDVKNKYKEYNVVEAPLNSDEEHSKIKHTYTFTINKTCIRAQFNDNNTLSLLSATKEESTPL